jgi:hypothetical protein
MNIQIKPAPRFLTTLTIGGINVTLEQNAIVSGSIIGDNGLRENYSLLMDDETYAQWGDDDAFVIDWTLEQLGLERP